jgi:hypothetical protein
MAESKVPVAESEPMAAPLACPFYNHDADFLIILSWAQSEPSWKIYSVNVRLTGINFAIIQSFPRAIGAQRAFLGEATWHWNWHSYHHHNG